MTELNTPLAIYRHLEKSNCGLCLLPSCLAFAAAVVKGDKPLAACPHVAPEILAAFNGKTFRPAVTDQAEALDQLREKIKSVDFTTAAGRTGGAIIDGRLVIPSMGKEFSVDTAGTVTSAIHVNGWLESLLLHYILFCRGRQPTGKWLPFRELNGAMAWNALFVERCEQPLKKLADRQPDFFEKLVSIFSGRRTTSGFSADIALLLSPLPRVPVLICYWAPEDDLDSKLTVFFDSTATDNLTLDALFGLGAGLTRMFEKIAEKHV